ncbi:hypothetical protein ACFLY2_02295 [Patescibacteria group bacterium]
MEEVKAEGYLEDFLFNNEEEIEENNVIYSPPSTYNTINEESEIL